MGKVDLSKPITKWDLYKLAFAMWALKLLASFRDWLEEVRGWLEHSEILWSEWFLPACLFALLLAIMWFSLC